MCLFGLACPLPALGRQKNVYLFGETVASVTRIQRIHLPIVLFSEISDLTYIEQYTFMVKKGRAF